MRVFKTDGADRVLDEICTERWRQDAKWGEQNHAPAVWLMILGEEVGEASREALEAWVNLTYPGTGHTLATCRARLMDYRAELVQVAAVAMAMIESVDRNELAGDRQGGGVT